MRLIAVRGHFLGHDTSRDKSEGQPAGEMAAAPGVVEALVLDGSGIVGMARTRMRPEGGIIHAAGIGIAETDGQRGAGGMALENAADDFGKVRFVAGSRPRSPGTATGQIRLKIRLGKGKAGSDTVQDDPDPFPVRLAEKADAQFASKRIHNCSKMSLNSGNDFATQALSSISIAPSAPSEATLRAITIR